ncbi:hypothetical protein L6164_030157 [Bauhinia variegata]|uniref:Uncharacterized protein n=1 Tax=Bauhinia variegata TaxID=167791 RepID=A0ACB9LB98_BAUVA|nr:hypothetical protein L6164_030157 [Bauhinia variegata]
MRQLCQRKLKKIRSQLAVEHYLSQSHSDPDSVKSIFDEELKVVENALRQNFKSYGAWHHRKWVQSKGYLSIDNELRSRRLILEISMHGTTEGQNFHPFISYLCFVYSF